jgi:hypothetical protein
MHAPTEIHDMLSNLKQSLYEERFYLRRLRRRRNARRGRAHRHPREHHEKLLIRPRGVGSDQSLQAMHTAVRHMIQTFDKFEEPFVLHDPHKHRHERRKSHRDDWSGDDHDHDGYEGGGAEFYDTEYKPTGFFQRCKWITTKSGVQNLLSAIERLQMRRVAMQTTDLMM